MQEILIKAGCYITVIILGIVLRRVGFFKAEDFSVLSKIVIKITLPAALISSGAGREISPAMLTISLLGFGGGVIYMAMGYLINQKKSKEDQAFEILNIPGYNIGTFALPFTQNFLGSAGVVTTSLFDMGNAFICLGVAFGAASSVKDGKGFDVKRVLSALATSIPFLTHILVVTLNLLHLQIPEPVISCAGIISNANAFLAMLMIGVGINLSGDFGPLGRIVRILGVRYGIAALLALAFYFLLPFGLEVRQTLVILAFSPMGSVMPGFTAELNGDVGLSCTLNSLSILISTVIIVALLVVML